MVQRTVPKASKIAESAETDSARIFNVAARREGSVGTSAALCSASGGTTTTD